MLHIKTLLSTKTKKMKYFYFDYELLVQHFNQDLLQKFRTDKEAHKLDSFERVHKLRFTTVFVLINRII